jgi:antitoxin component of MazEF toxin-antitoxin module
LASIAARVKYIPVGISLALATTVKLQKIGNSIRATIPSEVAEALALKPGEEMVVHAADDAVTLRRIKDRRMSDLYGVLGRREGRVRRWPSPEETKDIWG